MNTRTINSLRQTVLSQTLDNGLTVYVLPKPGFNKTFALLGTRYGGCDVDFSVDGVLHRTPFGVAHYLEHKMFDMPDGNSAIDALSANGANPNAYTSVDSTAYLIECTENVYENLALMLSVVFTPHFTPDSVDKERGIIGQELKMIEDSPSRMIFYNMLTGLYAHHPIRVPIGGTQESIAQITADTLNLCYKHFYNPSQMALCVAGDVDAQKVVDIVNSIVKPSAHGTIAREYGDENHDVAAHAVYAKQMEVAMPLFMLGYKLQPAERGADALRTELENDLASALLAGKSSPLYAKLYNDGLLSSRYEYGYFGFSGGACLLFGGESRDPAAVQAALQEAADTLTREAPDAALFERLKRAAYGQQLRMLDDSEALCRAVLRGHFLDYDAFSFPEIFATLTPESAAAALTKALTPPRASMSRIDPLTV